jgi:uncharacterized protein (TIGR03435 family)
VASHALRLFAIAFAATFAIGVLRAQSATAAAPAIEVSTVKPSDYPGTSIGLPGRTLTTRGTTLKDVIQWAYNVHPRQVLGGPGWIGTDKYDIVAKPEGGVFLDVEQIRLMLRTLMADRFQLRLRHETRELPVYALTIGKDGPKMKVRTEGDGGAPFSLLIGGPRWPVRNAPMALIVSVLQMAVLDRPVLDKTGLTGNFDFDLVWTPDETQFGGRGASMPGDPDAPNIFTAFQEQLGLKLEPQKALVDVLVIDGVEKPSGN